MCWFQHPNTSGVDTSRPSYSWALLRPSPQENFTLSRNWLEKIALSCVALVDKHAVLVSDGDGVVSAATRSRKSRLTLWAYSPRTRCVTIILGAGSTSTAVANNHPMRSCQRSLAFRCPINTDVSTSSLAPGSDRKPAFRKSSVDNPKAGAGESGLILTCHGPYLCHQSSCRGPPEMPDVVFGQAAGPPVHRPLTGRSERGWLALQGAVVPPVRFRVPRAERRICRRFT